MQIQTLRKEDKKTGYKKYELAKDLVRLHNNITDETPKKKRKTHKKSSVPPPMFVEAEDSYAVTSDEETVVEPEEEEWRECHLNHGPYLRCRTNGRHVLVGSHWICAYDNDNHGKSPMQQTQKGTASLLVNNVVSDHDHSFFVVVQWVQPLLCFVVAPQEFVVSTSTRTSVQNIGHTETWIKAALYT